MKIGRRTGFTLVELLVVIAVIGLLGDAALAAQPVEDLAVGRVRVEPVGLQRPEGCIGRVVEPEALVGAEDGDRRVELVQGGGTEKRPPF